MKSIVTGGAGFIGGHIVDALVKRGDEVIIIDDMTEGREENLAQVKDKVKLIVDSITNTEMLNTAFKGADAIFHQAALRSVPNSFDRPLDYHNINIDGTFNVLEAARKADVPRVVFASSSSVYGEGHPLPLREGYYPRPKSPYALSKLAGEAYMRLFHELYGLKTVSLRYFNVFGPRQPPDSQYAAVVPIFLGAARDNKAPTIFGTGEQSRDFTYVSNVVQANILGSEAKRGFGEPYNVADGYAVTVNDLATKIITLYSRNLKPVYEPPREGDVMHTLADLKKIREALGYVPVVNFDEGLEQTYSWFNATLK